jgi:uncharacterized protein with beta-barrel porin domain
MLKKYLVLVSTLMCSFANALQLPMGILGGQDNSGLMPAYAALIYPNETVFPLTLGLSNGQIHGVAMNALGQGIVGGGDFSGSQPAYAAFVSSTGIVSLIPLNLPIGFIKSAGINVEGQGIIGGQDLSGAGVGYAAHVFVNTGMATPITLPPSVNNIEIVAINASGLGIIGGQDGSGPTATAYAAFVPSTTTVANRVTLNISQGNIVAVGINNSGKGIVGGQDSSGSTPAYAAFVFPNGNVTPIAGLPASGGIFTVAINNSGQAIIGGQDFSGSTPAYVAAVAPDGSATTVTQGLPSNGAVFNVAINSSGQGIVGGPNYDTGFAYATFISPNGSATPISLGDLTSGVINRVAINDAGQAIIGGVNAGAAYAAIVSPNGVVTPLSLNLPAGTIISIAILPLLSHIPTESLDGNNLIFANYINTYAEENAFYFLPAIFDGTLNSALESAAPTRNAFSFYTVSNNLFYLTTGISTHIRQQRSLKNFSLVENSQISAATIPIDELQASLYTRKRKTAAPTCATELSEKKKHSFWFEALGAISHQKAQSQTPAFSPTSGGGLFAFDSKVSKNTTVGAGAAYLFTHIHEKQGAGHSDINQEDLFVYASWDNRSWYVDGSVLGGFFQIDQVRRIHMTGFEFKSSSKPNGWQLLPHIEAGYNCTKPTCAQTFEVRLNPFVMLDWASSWQESFKEKGSGPFNAGQKHHHASLLRTEVGIRFYETFIFDSWSFSLQEMGGYINTQTYGTGKVNAFLVGFPGAFTVETLKSAKNLGVGQFSIIVTPLNTYYPNTTFSYQGEFGVGYQSHQGMLELAWCF